MYGQSDNLGATLRQFCVNPGMNETEFATLSAQISGRLQLQLAAIVLPSLAKAMGEAITAKHPPGPGAYGLVTLRDVTAHHHGPGPLET